MDKESSATKNMIPTNDHSPVQRFAYFGNSLYPFHFGMTSGNNGRPANSDASPINDKRTDDSASPEHCFRLEYLPEAAEAKLVDYRGQKMAAFVVDGETMICLPQAYEIFLKHLVGGLHTVYTKLKRLEITPFVCNVEQVRALRSIGAIQPGVNRCKLIACRDFDVLYDDCASSNSKPGRPPKRCSLYGQGIFGHETPTHDAKKPKFSTFLQRNPRAMKFESDFNGGSGGSISAVQSVPSTAPVIVGGSSTSGDRTPLQPTATTAVAASAASSAPIFPFYNLNAPHNFFMSQLPFMAKQWSDYGMNAFKQCLENYGGQRMNSPAMTTSNGDGETPAATPEGTEASPQVASRGAAAFPFFASQWNNFSMVADDDKKGDGCDGGENGRENETNLESNGQKNDDKERSKSMDSDSSDAAVNLTVNNHHGSSSSSSSGCQISSSLEHKSTSSPLSSSSLSSSFGDNSESQSIRNSNSDNKLSDENGGKKSLSSSTKNEERQRKSSGQRRQSSKDRMNNKNQSVKKNIFPAPTSQIDLSNKNRSPAYDRPYANFLLDNKNGGNDGNNTAGGWTAATAPLSATTTSGEMAPFSSVQKLLFDVIRLMEMAAVTSQKQEEQFFKDKIELSKAYEEEKREKNRVENLLDEEKRAKEVYQKRWRQTMKKYKTLRERHSADQTTNNGSGGNSSEETNNDTLKMGADSSSMANEMIEAAAVNETLCGGGGVGVNGGNGVASRSSGYNSSSIKSPSYSCSSASLKKDAGSPPDGRCCESSGNCSSSDSSAAAANDAGKVQHRVHYRNQHQHHRHHHPYEHIKRSGPFSSGVYSSSTTSLSSATSSKAPISSPGSSDEKNCRQKLRGKNIQTSENKEKSAQSKENNNAVVDFSIRSSRNISHHTTTVAQESLPTTKIEVEKMEMN